MKQNKQAAAEQQQKTRRGLQVRWGCDTAKKKKNSKLDVQACVCRVGSVSGDEQQ